MPQKLSDTTKYHHPSLPLRERRTGRGNCGDQGMADGTPREGRWLVQLPWKGGGRVYHSTEGKKSPRAGDSNGCAYRWTRLGEVPRLPVKSRQGHLPVCWHLL